MRGRLVPLLTLLLGLAGLACDAKPAATAAPASAPQAAPGELTHSPRFVAKSLTFPAQARLVAFGDVHGDLDATKRALRLAGAIDEGGAWVGGALFVVQTGDQLDRGDDDRAILDLFKRLEVEAKAAGGTFLALNGNHELMNVALDFRYVTDGSLPAFAEFAKDARHAAIDGMPEAQRARAAAFFPGGVYAKRLAEQPIVAIVGDSVFVHGGVLMKHLHYGLEKMDAETRAWLRGERPRPPAVVMADDAPVWSRAFSAQTGPKDCAALAEVLDALGARRMVMGHTPQKPDISEVCDGRAVRIDTGMARYYQGNIEVLEIVAGKTRVLKE